MFAQLTHSWLAGIVLANFMWVKPKLYLDEVIIHIIPMTTETTQSQSHLFNINEGRIFLFYFHHDHVIFKYMGLRIHRFLAHHPHPDVWLPGIIISESCITLVFGPPDSCMNPGDPE